MNFINDYLRSLSSDAGTALYNNTGIVCCVAMVAVVIFYLMRMKTKPLDSLKGLAIAALAYWFCGYAQHFVTWYRVGFALDNYSRTANIALAFTLLPLVAWLCAKTFNTSVGFAGDVTALAGAMDLGDNSVLGIAMGTSEAGGYVDPQGNITGWLNELAFVPTDFCPDSMVDEWSGDYGCGVKYFSQDAVIKLAPAAGIALDEKLSPAEKLKVVQGLMKDGDKRAADIYDTIGAYFGYAIAYYAEFYEIKHVLIMGRVTSGAGGVILLERAQEVLDKEFPELSAKIKLHIPDENSRRVGQSVAAASLPEIK